MLEEIGRIVRDIIGGPRNPGSVSTETITYTSMCRPA